MALYARGRGLLATWYSGTVEDIYQRVSQGSPLIVMVDYGIGSLRKLHYMVVVGYTAEAVVVNTGTHQETNIDWPYFLSLWRRTHNWTLLVEKGKAGGQQ